jgi:hypothetical protein
MFATPGFSDAGGGERRCEVLADPIGVQKTVALAFSQSRDAPDATRRALATRYAADRLELHGTHDATRFAGSSVPPASRSSR